MKSDGKPELLGEVAMKAQGEENNQLLQSLESERLLLQTLIDSVPDFIFQKDREGRYVLANRSLANVIGFSDPKDMIGKTVREVFPRESAEKFMSNDRVVIATAQPYENIEEAVLCPAGSQTWLLTTRVPLLDKTGHVTGVIGIVRDITKRKELEKKNQQLATLVESSDDAIVGFGLNRRITVWNRGAERLYGYTAEEIIGAPTSLFTPPELQEEARLIYDRVMQGGQVRRYETTRLRKDGSSIMVSLTLSAIRDVEGRIVGMASTAHDITARKQAEKALRESEEHFRSVVMNAPFGIVHSTAEGRAISANPIFATMLGYDSPKELIEAVNRKNVAEVLYENGATRHAIVEKIMHSQRWERFELRYRRKDGTAITANALFRAYKHPVSGVVELEGFAEDITAHKQTEVALQESKRQLTNIIEFLPDATFSIDKVGRVAIWNKAIEKMTGIPATEMIGKGDHAYTIPFYGETRLQLLDVVLKNCEETPARYSNITREDDALSGEVFCSALRNNKGAWVFAKASPLRDKSGNIVGAIESIRDITARKQAEMALRDSERQLTNIIEFLPDATLAIDKEGRVIIWNKAIEKMTAVPATEMIGKGDHAYAIPFYGEAPVQLLDVVLKNCEETPAQYSNITREGDALSGEVFCSALYNNEGAWVFAKASPLRDQSGKIIGAIESIRDITDFKRAQEVLRQSERRLSDIVDFLPDATFAIDTKGTITAWNRAMERIMGKTKAQMLGCRSYEYAIPFYGYRRPILIDLAFDSREEIEKKYAFVERKGDTLIGEAFVPLLHDGKGAHFWGIATLLRDEKGMICGAIESVRDITEQRKAESEVQRLQEQLLQAQKMEAIGRLAGGIAHDFNNLLTAILGNVELIKAKDLARGMIAEIADEIQKAGLRAAALTQQLLAFSRKQMLQPKVIDLNGLVENLSKMLRRLIGEDIKLELRLGAGLGSVRADPGQIEQVILNLAVNARDAMSVGGRLVLETRNAASGEPLGPGRVDIPPGPYVIVTVSDNGVGMDETVKAHIFEPFFTTKELGKGTGLGLSTVYGIVKQSGGYVFVDSQPGRGTSFTIFLPQVDTEDTSREAPPIERRPNGGTERILLVEDEPSVLQLTTRMLEGFGYTVIGALTPSEALSLPVFADSRGVDLLITDMVLPGMKGTELARRLQERSPDLRVLFISGYTDERTFRDGVLAEGNAFLPKPFSENVLGKKVREVLDSHRP